MGSGRSATGGTVFLFKINLVYIINYFMFAPPNIYGYEKVDSWLTDNNNKWFVSKRVSTTCPDKAGGYGKRYGER